jgi:uncharacterized protein (TIGR02147 family)
MAFMGRERIILRRLEQLLEEKRQKNQRFGLRALARQLEIPAPTLSRILSGRRGLTLEMARRITQALTESPAERRRLLKAFALESGQAPAKATRYRHLTLEELRVLNHWGHSAILEVLRGERGIRSVPTIARASGLKESEAEKLLKDLKSLGLVDRTIQRGWFTQGQHLSSIRWEGTEPWRRVHAGYAERAVEYATRYQADEGSFQGITFLVSPGAIAGAKERIRDFAEELADELAQGEGRRLYRLNVQLFPMGKEPEQ